MDEVRGLGRWRRRIQQFKIETYALYLAYKDSRVPWYAKVFAACVVGYALSPIDLIPDFIPVLGYLDDLVLVPLGVTLALKMIPKPVLEECRERARESLNQDKPKNWVVASVIIAIWFVLAALIIVIVLRITKG
jgi:uncharacterized membrane protein YkvA (DUF1232 family)